MLHRFPSDFAALLTPAGRAALRAPAGRRSRTRFIQLDDLIDQAVALDCHRLLERHFSRLVRRRHVPLPAAHRLCEHTPFRIFVDTSALYLTPYAPEARRVAEQCGLETMMRSPALRRLVGNLTGYALKRPRQPHPLQLTRYAHGDYVGLHSDWRAAEGGTGTRRYLDVHLSFSNPDVESQYLIHQRGRSLSNMTAVHQPAALSISRLPFWHQTTPLIARPGKHKSASRWLIIAFFDLSQ